MATSLESASFFFGTVWFFGLLIAIAVGDVLRREISNRHVSALALGSLLSVIGGWTSVGIYLMALAVALSVMLLGALAHSRGWIGGGDVKFLAAASLWFAPAGALDLVAASLAFGGILALLVLALRNLARLGRLRIAETQRAFLEEDLCVPYGVAIAAGAALTFWLAWLR